MNKATANAKLVEVKLALARKCERLVAISKSVPKRKSLMNQAARFRRQAADLTRR